MYEVTYSNNGIVRKITVNGQDAIQALETVTNMFGKGNVQIINWRRIN